ncbi:MAG: hypothetical protein ACUVQI_10330 [Thermochromatium sp.]
MSVPPKHTPTILALGTVAAILTYAPVSQAFNFGDMMNPNRWFGGNRYDDRYWDDRPYGPWPYGGYGYPGIYGAPYGVPGFGALPAGYGVIPSSPSTPAPATPPRSSIDPGEVEALKRRIEKLESRQQQEQV